MDSSKEGDRRSAIEDSLPPFGSLSREDLYRLVWAYPIYKLAEHYGLSGNGLAGICRRMNVPVPSRGWWARKKVGQKVKIPPLPPQPSEAPRQERRGRPRKKLDPQPATQPPSEPKAEAAPAVKVSKRLTNPHPLIIQFLDKPMPAPGVREWTRSDRNMRILRIYDALFKLLEAGGCLLRQTGRTYRASMLGVEVEFYLREGSPGAVWNAGWIPPAEDGRETRLTFVSKSYYIRGIREQWPESKRKRLEEIVPEYAASILQAIPIQAEKERLRKEQYRREEEERARLAELERLKAEDDARWNQFVKIARRQEEANQVRRFLGALEERAYDPNAIVAGRPLREWVRWAHRRADNADFLAKGIEAAFMNISL